MKTLIRIVFLVMIAFCMSYCSMLGTIYPTTEKYQARLDTWTGKDVNSLISSWGPPGEVFTMPNGNKMYTWMLTTGGTDVTTNYNYYLNQSTSNSHTNWCKTTFTVNKSDKIINNTWEGNSCRSSSYPTK